MYKRKNYNTPSSTIIMKKPKHLPLGKVPKFIVKETDRCVVITDKYPKAKIHYLILPHENISTIYKLNSSHLSLLDEFDYLFREIQDNVEDKLRAGFHAITGMQKLHMHVISEDMVSPHLKTMAHWNSFTTSFFIPLEDLQHELQDKGCIKRISPELHKQLLATELHCNQCAYEPSDMSDLKEHLLTHID